MSLILSRLLRTGRGGWTFQSALGPEQSRFCIAGGAVSPVTKGGYVAQRLLKLYIAGNSAASRRAEQNLVRLGAGLPDWQTEIIDVLTMPELAERAGVLATPTLAYEHPERPRRVIGDLSNAKRVLEFLGIEGYAGE